MFWVIIAAMTAAALGLLVWPLQRRSDPQVGAADADLAVYRDQLAELDRDVARGLIRPDEGQAARNEVARRMLAAAEASRAATPHSATGDRKAALVSAMIGIPAVALSTYLIIGRPDLPGLPQAERLATAVDRNDFAAMMAQVEAHLAKSPTDAQGWIVLAPAYRRLGRYGDAAEALARALELVPPTPALLTDYGEALVLAQQGIVPAKARNAFEQALALDKADTKARFYLALADRQEGKHAEALAAWRAMLEEGPANAPWREAVERQVASLERDMSGAPQLGEEELARAERLSGEERQEMVKGMVDRLASRLEQDGKDLQGWLRLARARMVLGQRDAATAALKTAEHHFMGDQASLALIEDTRRSLGLGEVK